MILSFLLLHSLEDVKNEYSLMQPFETTKNGEIGNWTLIGTSENLKTKIRLTNAVPSSSGSICQRIPTLFKDWSAEIELQSSNHENESFLPGHGIWFFYSNEVCQEMSLDFKGFSFWINTTSTMSDGMSDLHFMIGNTTSRWSEGKVVGRVQIRDDNKSLFIRIAKKDSEISIDAMNESMYVNIFTEKCDNIPDYGYFTITGLTTTKRADNNDIISFRLNPLSPVDHPQKDFDFSTENREIIQKKREEQKKMKKMRQEKMKALIKYLNHALSSEPKLNEKDNIDIKEAVKIIDETYKKNKDKMTHESLEHFIEEAVEATADAAEKKLNMAATKYKEAQQDIDDMWVSLKQQLSDIINEEKEAFQIIREEVLEFGKNIDFKNTKHSSETQIESNGDSNITFVLVIICLVEGALYFVFLVFKHRKSNHNKKND